MTRTYVVRRLRREDAPTALSALALLREWFEEPGAALSFGYVEALLALDSFWLLVALNGDTVVGALTAHTLPLTRCEGSEIFIYDIAVAQEHRRAGVGARLVQTLRELASAESVVGVFVAADAGDTHALDFYRAIGGTEGEVRHFDFEPR